MTEEFIFVFLFVPIYGLLSTFADCVSMAIIRTCFALVGVGALCGDEGEAKTLKENVRVVRKFFLVVGKLGGN